VKLGKWERFLDSILVDINRINDYLSLSRVLKVVKDAVAQQQDNKETRIRFEFMRKDNILIRYPL
jgi:DNA polymerase IIIc chi subunit